MKVSRLAILVLSICLLTAPLLAYTLDGGGVTETECNDGVDNDEDTKIDGDGIEPSGEEPDPGCTRPYYDDNSEANIWDTDLTSVMAGVNSETAPPLDETESVFFDGSVRLGNDEVSDSRDDEQGGGGVEEHYIDGVYNESESYGGGGHEKNAYTGFPEGTVLLDPAARAIDPPNPGSDISESGVSVQGSEQTCGDGIENEPVTKTGDDGNQAGSTTSCRADYGRTEEKYNASGDSDVETPYNHRDEPGMQCRDDEASCEDNSYSSSSSSSCSCTADADISCSIDTNNQDDEDNYFWETDGDDIYRMDCENDGGWVASDSTTVSCSYSDSWTYSCSCGKDCTTTCTDSCSGTNSDSDSDEAGYYRSWHETDRKNCNDYNVVDGGGELSADDKSTNKADNDAAGTYTEFTAHSWDNGVGDGWSWCGYESTLTVDADGPKGYGDGFVVIEGNNIVATEGPTGEDTVGQRIRVKEHSAPSGVTSRTESLLGGEVRGCPNDKDVCLRYVDYYTAEGSGTTSGSPNWDNWQDAVKNDEEVYYADESYSVCKNINRINKEHGDGTELIQCDIEIPPPPPDDSNEGTGVGPYTEACEDEPEEWYVYMEGPEVNNEASVMEENPGHYQGCVDGQETDKWGDDLSSDSCVVKGDPVAEGTVANVAPNPDNSDAKYERGGNSPDWEVCLNIEDGSGDDVEGDNREDGTDKGGEWYDLDSENAQDYLRSGGNDLVTGGDSGDINDIAYYWNDGVNSPQRDNPVNAPQNDEHNPQGGKEGIALEDDCGNPRFDSIKCDDQEDQKSRGYGDTDTFFSFFEEGLREEDFHPQGDDTDTGENFDRFTGVTNRMQERSNQLEPGMDTDAYSSSDYNIWEDTRGGEYADEWAISTYLNWSIDSTGTPYPPYSTWYRDASDRRTSTDDDSIDKMQKAFGNSYAAVATETFTGDSDVTVDPGDGVWIDPDAMKTVSDVKLTSEGAGWREALRMTDTRSGINNGFKIDLTGKDAGFGIDVDVNPECLSARPDGGCKVVATEIEWEKNDAGNIESELETPMCGDDRLEFFIEQAGEIDASNRYDGPYACADSLNSCYDKESPGEPSIVDQGAYRNVDEPEEDDGRLKVDAEYCQKIDGQDDFAVWYDQDYRESFCRENTLYGQDGIRWFPESYVTEHPKAVMGGIDDSWNDYLNQMSHESFDSQPGNVGSGITPVPTGDFNDVTATRGFCGGDDDSEYLVTQECNTRYCETDRTIQGVAKVPGSCVMRAEDSLYENEISERSIYNPGERVEITEVQGSPEVACFNGVWFSDWPISFNEDEVEVPVGGTRTVSFDVINTRDTDTTFKITMEEDSASPSADQFAQFTEHSGDSFTTTVKGTSSKTFRIELTGGNENLDIGDPGSDLTVRADAINAGLVGSDSVAVGIEPKSNIGTGTSSTETRDVPGIKTLQLVVMMILSTLVYFNRRRS